MASVEELEIRLYQLYEEMCVKKHVKKIAVKVMQQMETKGLTNYYEESDLKRKAKSVAIKKFRERPFYAKQEEALAVAQEFCRIENAKCSLIKITAYVKDVSANKGNVIFSSKTEQFQAKYGIGFKIESKIDKAAASDFFNKNKKKKNIPDYNNRGVALSLAKKLRKAFEVKEEKKRSAIRDIIKDSIKGDLSTKDFTVDRNGHVKTKVDSGFTRSLHDDIVSAKAAEIVQAGAILNVSVNDAVKAVSHLKNKGTSSNNSCDSLSDTLGPNSEVYILEAIRLAGESGEKTEKTLDYRINRDKEKYNTSNSNRAKTLEAVINSNDPDIIGEFVPLYNERLRTEEEMKANALRLAKETKEMDSIDDDIKYSFELEDNIFDLSKIEEAFEYSERDVEKYNEKCNEEIKQFKKRAFNSQGKKEYNSYLIDVAFVTTPDGSPFISEQITKKNSPTADGMMLGEEEKMYKGSYILPDKPLIFYDPNSQLNFFYKEASDRNKFQDEEFKRRFNGKEIPREEVENWINGFNKITKHRTMASDEFGKHNRTEEKVYNYRTDEYEEISNVIQDLKENFSGDEKLWKYAYNINIFKNPKVAGSKVYNILDYKTYQEMYMPKVMKEISDNFNTSTSSYVNKISKQVKINFDKMSALLRKRNYRKNHSLNPAIDEKDIKDAIVNNLGKAIKNFNRIVNEKGKSTPVSAMELNYVSIIDSSTISIDLDELDQIEYGPKVKNQPYTAVLEVATPARKSMVRNRKKQRSIRKAKLKPIKLPIKILKNYLLQREYGDMAAACFFQILVSNTPIDEPYHYKKKYSYYKSKRVWYYKYKKNPLYDSLKDQLKGWPKLYKEVLEYTAKSKTLKELNKEKEASRELVTKEYDAYHTPDKDVVRDCWEFRYKGHTFKSNEKRFNGLFDVKADEASIIKIAQIFNKATKSSKVKSIAFSYKNTNPRWEQLEYGGYTQNNNSGPWKGEGKYQFKHGVIDHFTYQAPKGYLRLIEAQWNALMENNFEIKKLTKFINNEGFKVSDVKKEVVEQLRKYAPTLGTRNYDIENIIFVQEKGV